MIIKALPAKIKKHIGTVGYYNEKSKEEFAKIQAFIAEQKIDNADINAAVAAVQSGGMTAENAITTIDGILAKAYDEVKKAEDAAKKAEAAAKKEEIAKAAAAKVAAAKAQGAVAAPATAPAPGVAQ